MVNFLSYTFPYDAIKSGTIEDYSEEDYSESTGEYVVKDISSNENGFLKRR